MTKKDIHESLRFPPQTPNALRSSFATRQFCVAAIETHIVPSFQAKQDRAVFVSLVEGVRAVHNTYVYYHDFPGVAQCAGI